MKQTDMILDFIAEHGYITPIQAITELGCTRLAARIADIEKQGIEVQRERVEGRNRYGKKTYYMRYWV